MGGHWQARSVAARCLSELAGEPLDQTDDEALGQPMFLPRITEMDGRGGLFVEVAGGIEGFKHQMICVLLRMISEVLKMCDRGMKGFLRERQNRSVVTLRFN
jgi:hypothetical protein